MQKGAALLPRPRAPPFLHLLLRLLGSGAGTMYRHCQRLRAAVPKHGPAGLYNQGLTYYINSLIQQLFMMPELRRGVLAAVPRGDAEAEAPGQEQIALPGADAEFKGRLQELLRGVQGVFTGLLAGKRRY